MTCEDQLQYVCIAQTGKDHSFRSSPFSDFSKRYQGRREGKGDQNEVHFDTEVTFEDPGGAIHGHTSNMQYEEH